MNNNRIAYFINTYPKVSHTFIRREILALERQGAKVLRIALRGWNDVLPDEVDQTERDRTHYILRDGLFKLVVPVLRVLARSPVQFVRALLAALRMVG